MREWIIELTGKEADLEKLVGLRDSDAGALLGLAVQWRRLGERRPLPDRPVGRWPGAI